MNNFKRGTGVIKFLSEGVKLCLPRRKTTVKMDLFLERFPWSNSGISSNKHSPKVFFYGKSLLKKKYSARVEGEFMGTLDRMYF